MLLLTNSRLNKTQVIDVQNLITFDRVVRHGQQYSTKEPRFFCGVAENNRYNLERFITLFYIYCIYCNNNGDYL